MDPGLVGLDVARGLAVPSADPEPFEADVAADVGQQDPGQGALLQPGVVLDLQVGQPLPARREDQHPPAPLVEVGQQVGAARAVADGEERRHVGLMLDLAMRD